MSHANPFFAFRANDRDFFHVGSEDRLRRVKEFDLDQCRAALAIEGMQSTVIKAIERRMRKLEKGAGHA